MRPMVILTAVLLAAGGLAGCIGKDDTSGSTVDKNKVGGTPNVNVGGGSNTVVNILAPLRTAISTDGAAWVQAGSSYPVEASMPANAEGDVTFTWAFGPDPTAATAPAVTLDTGIIQPGAKASLVYETAGVFGMHCHPHPFMLHNVTVVEGVESSGVVHVQIVDGASESEYRFVPENIVVGVGTEVVYHNNGTQAHTATLGAAEPALALLPLTEASGEITLATSVDGWHRIVVFVQDAEGRIGTSQRDVYVTATLPEHEPQTFTGTFTAALPAGVDPATHPFELELGGKALVTIAVDDPTGQEVNKIVMHLRETGATQDSMTSDPVTSAELKGTLNKGSYVLEVVPNQGANIAYTVTVAVTYDLVPPPKESGETGGGDGHAH